MDVLISHTAEGAVFELTEGRIRLNPRIPTVMSRVACGVAHYVCCDCMYFHILSMILMLLLAIGRCWGWGDNTHGQLANPLPDYVEEARVIDALSEVHLVDVACGARHTLVSSSMFHPINVFIQ